LVFKGQFLERPTLIPSGGVVLEGLSHRGHRRPLLLILPPPLAQGGGMDHVVAAELAWAAASRDFPTLRFNYRGVGGSQGQRGRGKTLLEDAAAALQLGKENSEGGPVAVVALGASARVALALEEKVGGLAFIALVSPSELTVEELGFAAAKLLVVFPEESRPADLSAWAAAIEPHGGHVEVIHGADVAFLKQLPEVGKAVVRQLERGA
jgi:alpha/beta superfamily hydrolase